MFTYDLVNPNDITRVRFHIADTDANIAVFQDEEILFVLLESGGWQNAVIVLITNIIAKLSTPDFKADWLTVDSSTAVKAWQNSLAVKRAEFGIRVASISATAILPYRVDSLQTASPNYAEDNGL
jgi:hypothetical protein